MTGTSSVFRDPQNGAFSDGKSWFRVADEESADALRSLQSSPLYDELVSEGVIPLFEELSEGDSRALMTGFREISPRSLPNRMRVFRVEKVEPISFPWEWPNVMLQLAGLLTLSLRSRLLAIGLDLKDASALNIQFRGLKPVLIDIGSIEFWKPEPGWSALRQFVEHFINPLAVGASPVISSAQAWRLGNGQKGLASAQSRRLLPLRQKLSLGLGLIQAATIPRRVGGMRPAIFSPKSASERALCLRANQSLVRRLRKIVLKLETKIHRSTWATYGSRHHYSLDEIETKKELARLFVGRNAVLGETVLDIGGNDGLIGIELANCQDVFVIVADSDPGALDLLSRQLEKHPSLNRVMPIVVDVLSPDIFRGALGGEFEQFSRRVRPKAVLCHAVLHHLVITQGVPMGIAVAALGEYGAPLQIEFVTEEDSKVQDLLAQIHGWRGDYSLAVLVEALTRFYQQVEVVGKTTPTRVIVEASRPISGLRGEAS